MSEEQKKLDIQKTTSRIFDDWRVLAALLIALCLIIIFVVPRRYLGIVRYQPRQSKVVNALGGAAPRRSVIVITEIMYHPASNKVEDEYIELYNTSAYRIALDDWQLRGVQYKFPRNTIIEAHDYLVVAADPQHIKDVYRLPDDKVVGAYNGRLSNRGEKIQMVRPDGSIEDDVAYDDGVHWDNRADGYGPSLELLNPELDNSLPEAWRISMDGPGLYRGTPGRENTVYQKQTTGIIKDITFMPLLPEPDEPVDVSCIISGTTNIQGLLLWYRNEKSTQFRFIRMENGEDGRYTARIPPQGKNCVVEFCIEAREKNGARVFSPSSGKIDPYVFAVDKTKYTSDIPIYRIIMSSRNKHTLTTRDVRSNVPLTATFIADDTVWLGVKIHYRGDTSRMHWKKSYRIDFPQHKPFGDRTTLYLNGSFWERQFTGSYLYTLTGLPTPEVKLVRLIFNDEDLQTYARVERVDNAFIRRWFPNDVGGNLYRGLANANLDYRGEDKEKYRSTYEKYNNKEEDDYDDIIKLSRAFSYPSNDGFVERLEDLIDIEQWITYFACTAALGNQEGIYYFEEADDYFLYRLPSSGKFVIIPWDFDATCHPVNQIISQECTETIRRFLFHPDIRPRFYKKIYELLSDTFEWEKTKDDIEPLRALTSVEKNYPVSAYTGIEKFLKTRIDTFRETFPEKLTASILTTYAETILPEHDNWEMHIGWFDPPTTWNDTDTTFTWYQFPAGMGYNHRKIKALCDFADYSSLYIRNYFTIPEYFTGDNLRLLIEFSDGFVAYLNGKEIARRLVGTEGVVPAHYEKAVFHKNRAEPEVFDLSSYVDLLRKDSKNVLAIQGHIQSADEPYFIIHPWLLSGGPVPYNAVITSDSVVSIGGTIPIFETAEALVNDEHAECDFILGSWHKRIDLRNGWNLFSIKAFDKDAALLDTTTLEIFYSPTATPLHGTITTDTLLSRQDSPYHVKQSLVVPSGVTLTIEPGCVFVFSPGAGIDVRGRLVAVGTDNEPIHFTALDRYGKWNGLRFVDTRQENRLERCIISSASWWDNLYVGAVECVNSNILMKDCRISDASLVGMDIRDSIAVLDSCRFSNIFSGYDGDIIQIIGNSHVTIDRSLLENTNADAIDISGGNLDLRRTILRNCEDKALSLSGGGTTSINKVIMTDCLTGIGLKNVRISLKDTIIAECDNGIKFFMIDASPPPAFKISNSAIWRTKQPLEDLPSADIIKARYSYIQNYPALSIKGDYNMESQFINVEERDFRLYLYSYFMSAGENGTPLIDTTWLNDITW